MDLLGELQQKISTIDSHGRIEGIKAAVRHIEVGEKYLSRGRNDGDSDSFNDVIYRTNQAFEGMLKEAYSVIEERDGTRLSPNQIEQYFIDNKRLTERVWGLFRTYRQQWRNPSTHDHTLLFSEQEAVLAIVNVSAFALVLLDQIVETISFKRHKAETSRRREAIAKELAESSSSSLIQHTLASLQLFIRETSARGEVAKSEAELVGSLSGFLAGLDATLEITPDARLGHKYHADLLIKRGHDLVVIECKRGRASAHFTAAAIAQMRESLMAAHADAGILFFWTPDGPSENEISSLPISGTTKTVWILGADVNLKLLKLLSFSRLKSINFPTRDAFGNVAGSAADFTPHKDTARSA